MLSGQLGNGLQSIATKDISAWDTDRKYGIVIDAGSSGSRILIYSWLIDGNKQEPLRIEKADESGLLFQLKEKPGTLN